jgi:hypothetical protein
LSGCLIWFQRNHEGGVWRVARLLGVLAMMA